MAACALVGGETAEMPSFYPEGEYDLAGFAVGVVEKDRIINGSQIKAGDAVIGLASNGLHSNGYSLVRHLLFDINKFNVNDTWDNSGMKLSEELLKPTRIYVKPVLEILAQYSVKGMVHITGGGLPGNIKRVIPDGLMASIHIELDSIPRIFHFLMKLGNIEFQEMCSTFNMGTGFVLIVDRNDEKTIIDLFGELGEKASTLGYVEQTNQNEKVRLI
jgi:phosphoribosylformylglycinamidine cyclo-ligase